MPKGIVAILAVTLAGTATADGWRSLRVDGTSQASFEKSVAALQEKLSPARRQVFVLALHDIWNEGTKAAEANHGEYTADEYLRHVDGLGYKEIVTLTDPTGDTAQARYRDAAMHAHRVPRVGSVSAANPPQMRPDNPAPIGWSGNQVRGIDDQNPVHAWATRP